MKDRFRWIAKEVVKVGFSNVRWYEEVVLFEGIDSLGAKSKD